MQPETILVIEDDEDIREAVLDTLHDQGFAAEGAPGAARGLDLLRSTAIKPAVVLLDLMMPGMSGADFRAEQLRDPSLASIPIVVLSADVNIEARCAELGAAGCLKKPFHLDALIAVAERFAKGARSTGPQRVRS
jgi:CheY-like chemotaxis protein